MGTEASLQYVRAMKLAKAKPPRPKMGINK